MYDLGLILKRLRTDSGYTQGQIAKKINVSVTTIGRWESNYKQPTTEHLIDLSILYNVPLNYLVGIEKEKSIVIERLTDNQKTIMNSLLLEFQSKKQNSKELSKRQQEILNALINEFNK
jgi:transcriptional regulator with XRE-family HTH domain